MSKERASCIVSARRLQYLSRYLSIVTSIVSEYSIRVLHSKSE